MNFQKIKLTDSLRNTFYMFPKWLKEVKVSNDAKLLYMYLKDRFGLSIMNNWCDEDGNVYLYYTITQMEDDLSCRKQKALKVFNELKDENLVVTKQQGLGLPNMIYVLEPTDEYLEELLKPCKEKESTINLEKSDENIFINDEDEIEEDENEVITIGKRHENIEKYKKYENHTSRSMKIILPEVRKSYPNKTNNNKTNINNNNNNKELVTKLNSLNIKDKDVVVVFDELKNNNRTDADLERYIDDIKNKCNIRNVMGYLLDSIRNDYKCIPKHDKIKNLSTGDRISNSELREILKNKELQDLGKYKNKLEKSN